MLTEMLNGGDPSIELVTSPSQGAEELITLLTVKWQDTTLEVRFKLCIEGVDMWLERARTLRRVIELYYYLWATVSGFVLEYARELPEPLRENLGTWRYFVYRDVSEGVEIRVELQQLEEDEDEEEWRYQARCEEYEADCRTLAEAAVHAYEIFAKQRLNLE